VHGPKTKLQQFQEAVRSRAELVRLGKEERRAVLAQALAERRQARQVLAEARFGDDGPRPVASLQRVEIVDPQRSSMWTGLAVGFSIAALAGAIIVIAVMRRREDGQSDVRFVSYPMPTSTPGGLAGAEESDDVPTVRVASRPTKGRVMMRTVTLPSLTVANSQAIRIAHAPDNVPYETTIRVVGPPGAFAVIASTAGALAASIGNIGAAPTGDTSIIPAGDKQIVHLKPGQGIVAKGSVPNVQVSVTMSEYTVAGL